MSIAPGTEEPEGFVVRARGLPWSSTAEDIIKFFECCKILGGKEGIHFTFTRQGRPSGECFVEFETDEDMELALTKHKKDMGSRYVEVFRSKVEEREWVMKRSGPATFQDNEGCVRMRGIPYECSKEEILQFFTGLEIVANGVTLPTDQEGRCTGEAFVQFATKEVAEKALGKHMKKLGHRYVEIFRSNMDEICREKNAAKMARSFQRPGPYDRCGPGAMFGGGRGRGPASSGFERRYRFDGFGGGYEDNFYGMDDYSFGGYAGMGGMMGRRGRGGMRGGNLGMRGGFGRGGGGGGGGGGFGGGSYGGGSGSGGGGSSFGGPGGDSMGPAFVSQTGFSIHMRGLPFSATEGEIMEWFGKKAVPCRVVIKYNAKGQPSGEADVDFIRHRDAVAAMCKDKEHMKHRYIELFLNSKGDSDGGDGGGYGDISGGGGYGGQSGPLGGQGGGFGNQGNGFGNQSGGMRSGGGYTSFESQGSGYQGNQGGGSSGFYSGGTGSSFNQGF